MDDPLAAMHGERVEFRPAQNRLLGGRYPGAVRGERTAWGLVLHPSIDTQALWIPNRWDVSDPITGCRIVEGDPGRACDGYRRRGSKLLYADHGLARMAAVSALIRVATRLSRDERGQPVPGGFRAVLDERRRLALAADPTLAEVQP